MSVCPLLPVLGFLLSTPGAMGASDVFLLFGFGFDLVVLDRLWATATLEGYSIFKDILKVIHSSSSL